MALKENSWNYVRIKTGMFSMDYKLVREIPELNIENIIYFLKYNSWDKLGKFFLISQDTVNELKGKIR